MVVGIMLAFAVTFTALLATELADSPAELMGGEKLYGFRALSARVPGHRDNAHINPSTLFRWSTRGVKTPDGRTVRLEAVRIGTAWKSSVEALARFSAALTAASLPADAGEQSLPPTPAARNRAAAAATAELSALLGAKKS